MHILTGEIGKLSLNGEQVGGFKYWTAMVRKNPPSTSVIASKFWMLKEIDTDQLQAEFYVESNNGLKFLRVENVIAKIPPHQLDTMYIVPLTMRIDGLNWVG